MNWFERARPRSIRRRHWLIAATCAVAALVALGAVARSAWDAWSPNYTPDYEGPFGVYITLGSDPAHGMTVHYQALEQEGAEASNSAYEPWCYYDILPHGADLEAYRYRARGEGHAIPGLSDARRVCRIAPDQLEPGQTYYFVAGDSGAGYSQERKFRTLPGGDAPLRFVVGGDMGGFPSDSYPNTLPLLRQAAKRDPQFAVLGGDIAYGSGDLRRLERWDKWFEAWSDVMVTSDGCSIPIVAAIGNHEANDEPMGAPDRCAPFYTAYFGGAPTRSYFAVDLADYARLFVLDSGYLAPISGAQAVWLDDALAAARDIPVKMAAYHVPMYPAGRDFDGDHSTLERETWLPLFDQYGLTTAFEHHDHVLKRSLLLRGNRVDPAGTLYLGDGCFGVKPRAMRGPDRWYLETRSSQAHFWLVKLDKENGAAYEAIGPDGAVLDHCSMVDAPA